ncbi:hypothetical protein F441_07302, partial [Phytophthora nicotianae CJ01A1]
TARLRKLTRLANGSLLKFFVGDCLGDASYVVYAAVMHGDDYTLAYLAN